MDGEQVVGADGAWRESYRYKLLLSSLTLPLSLLSHSHSLVAW